MCVRPAAASALPQLIEAETGAHLWADRFDGSLEEVFDLQDQVAISVAGAIEPTLQAAETRRSAGRPTADLTAYDLYLRAYAAVSSGKRHIFSALGLLEQAIARDPNYGPALALAAYCQLHLFWNGWAESPESARCEAIRLARAALEIARADPAVLANVAYVFGGAGEDIRTAIGLIDRCLALSPSYSRWWYVSAVLRAFAGEPDLAIEHAERCLRLSPLGDGRAAEEGASLLAIGMANLLKRRFDEAAEGLSLCMQERPSNPWIYRHLASCLAHLGRLDEAREIVARLRSLTPLVIPNGTLYRKPEHQELFISGLRLAAGET